MSKRHRYSLVLICGYLVALAASRAEASPTPEIRLCPGLTVVTAVSQKDGDYESIKRVTAVSEKEVTLHYSNERMVSDFLSSEPPRLVRTELDRVISRVDLQSAMLYLQVFDERLPEYVPETTAIGISTAAFQKIKSGEATNLGLFIPFSTTPSLNREQHPNVYDNAMIASVQRTNTTQESLRVIVDGQPVDLPAVRVVGDFFSDKTELWLLDNPENPLTLRYRFGMDIFRITPEMAKTLDLPEPKPEDRDRFDVIKIETTCVSDNENAAPSEASAPDGDVPGLGLPDAVGSAGGSKAVAAMADQIETALLEDRPIDLYTIHFSFGKSDLRPESAETIEAIAFVLKNNPSWGMQIVGHTDSVGEDVDNLALSDARAEEVKAELVSRHMIDPQRLMVAGRGESAPVADNDTPTGRALNRRVEISKLD